MFAILFIYQRQGHVLGVCAVFEAGEACVGNCALSHTSSLTLGESHKVRVFYFSLEWKWGYEFLTLVGL